MQIGPIALTAVLCLGTAGTALAQSGDRSDNDPTRPILFSIRPEMYRFAGDVWRSQIVARYDTAMMRKRRFFTGHRGLLLRFELPFVAAGAPSVPGSQGLGDAYGQLLVVPKLTGRFALAAGTGLVFPTATSKALGGGKWTLAPAVVPVWFLRGRGLALVRVQNFVSIAGDRERPDANVLFVQPMLLHTLGRSSWVMIDTESRTDWQRDGRTSLKSGVQYGLVLKNGLGLWVKPEVGWGPNRDNLWNVKTGFVWYRARG